MEDDVTMIQPVAKNKVLTVLFIQDIFCMILVILSDVIQVYILTLNLLKLKLVIITEPDQPFVQKSRLVCLLDRRHRIA